MNRMIFMNNMSVIKIHILLCRIQKYSYFTYLLLDRCYKTKNLFISNI